MSAFGSALGGSVALHVTLTVTLKATSAPATDQEQKGFPPERACVCHAVGTASRPTGMDTGGDVGTWHPHLPATIPRGLNLSGLLSYAQRGEAAGPSDNPRNRPWNSIRNLFSLLFMHCAMSSLPNTEQTIWVLFIFRIKSWEGEKGRGGGCFNFQDPIKHLSHSVPQPLQSSPVISQPGLHPAKLCTSMHGVVPRTLSINGCKTWGFRGSTPMQQINSSPV